MGIDDKKDPENTQETKRNMTHGETNTNEDKSGTIPQDTPTTTPSLESIIGASNVDKAIKAAIEVWNNFISSYPDSLFNKSFLRNNQGLLKKIVDVVVPGMMSKVVALEREADLLSETLLLAQQKILRDVLSLAALIPITASLVESHDQLDDVLASMEKYNFVGIQTEDDIIENESMCDSNGFESDPANIGGIARRKLANPVWVVCATLPNETLSPHIVDHGTYTSLVMTNTNVKTVDLYDCPLMAESDDVANLIDEIDNKQML